jgi:sugar phosphate permease
LPFYYGWMIVACSFATLAIGVNARTVFSLLLPEMIAEFGWTRAETAGAFSIGFVMAAILGPVTGAMLTRFGARALMPIGSVMMAAGFVATAYVSESWMLYPTFGVLVIGASTVLGYIGHAATLPLWFQRRRGLAVGLAFSGVGIGAVIVLPLVTSIIGADGWRDACWAVAIMVLVLLLPLNLIVQRRRPSDLGLLPDGDARTIDADGNLQSAEQPVGPTLGDALRHPSFWLIALAAFCILWMWYGMQVHQTQFLLETGFSAATASQALALVSAAGVISQITAGWLADKIGRESTWTIGCLGFIACFGISILLRQAPSEWLMWTMVLAQGLLGYGLTVVFASAPADLFNGRQFSTIFGCLSVAASLGGGAGPFFTGLLFDIDGNYDRAFMLALSLGSISIVAMWLAAPRRARRPNNSMAT